MSVHSRSVWSAVILTVCGGLFVARTIAAEQQPTRDVPVYAVIYPASDLPVFRPGNPIENFDPSLMIALMKEAVDPTSWTKGDGAVAVFPNNLSLVITQTEANHAKIAKLLKAARKSTRK